MLDGPFALALAAGMAATVNPCGFALLPAYLAAFIGDGHEPGLKAIPRALTVSAAVTAGFVLVFGIFGVVISPLALTIEEHLPWVTMVIGIGLVGLGIALLAGREIMLHTPKLEKGGRDGTLVSMFVFGISYAIASLSCTIGPFLAVTTSTFRADSLLSGIAVFVTYALGMGLIVAVLTVAAALAHAGVAKKMKSVLPYVSRFSGALLVVAGAYVAWYGWYEVRVLRGDDVDDPIVDAAQEVQAWAQDLVTPDDPVTAALVMALVLACVALGVVWIRHRRDTSHDH